MNARVDFGARQVRLRTRWLSTRVSRRGLISGAVLAGISLVLAVLALGLGDYWLDPLRVLAALTGRGDDLARMIVLDWRLPIILAALLFGALLGVGGAIFQSLTRNPLGSPDVIGFDAGAYTAVVLTMLVLGRADYTTIASAALAGGVATALLVYVLAYRRGVQGFRLIIVGIAVAALLGSINAYLITRADLEDAIAVGFWGAGSIARVSWATLLPALPLIVVVFIAAAALSPALRRLELGDDAAVTLGTRVGPTRLALIIVGVATTALVTAAAGPIAFIALGAPQLARRITRSPGVSLPAAAMTGAALLMAAHLLALVLGMAFATIPVGLITVCLGGGYLIWLLVHEARRTQGEVTR